MAGTLGWSSSIDRIRSDAAASYLPFTDADALTDRVVSDLATLLAERFDESRWDASDDKGGAASPVAHLPEAFTTTIGREQDIARVRELLERDDNRVVTLVGPGGIGKSRLAIEVAHATEDLFPDGTYFVPLEGVREAGLLLPTIAYVLGIRDNGEAGLEERLSRALEGRRVLIVLDDFEQIVATAPVLVRLHTVAPLTSFLVTSRIVLRIRGEQVYEVESLRPPEGTGPTSSGDCPAVVGGSAVRRPSASSQPRVRAHQRERCRRLGHLPKTRGSAPGDRTGRRSGARAHAGVHRAATGSQPLSADGCHARHAQSAPNDARPPSTGASACSRTSSVVCSRILASSRPDSRWRPSRRSVAADRGTDKPSMRCPNSWTIRWSNRSRSTPGRPSRSWRSCGSTRSGASVSAVSWTSMRVAHADYYTALVRRLSAGLRGAGQAEAVRQLGLEVSNLRAAVRHLIDTNRLDDAGEFAWNLFVYWWISGFLSEVRLWMLELLEKQQPFSQHTRAVAQFFALWAEMWQRPSDQVVAGLGECARLFAESGDEDAAAIALAGRAHGEAAVPRPGCGGAEAELTEAVAKFRRLGDGWSESMAEVGLGWVAVVGGRLDDALAHFARSAEIADEGQDLYTRAVAGNNRTRVLFLMGDMEAAEREWLLTLRLSIRLHYEEGVTFALDGLSAIAAYPG